MHIAEAHGWSLAQVLAGFSIALGVSGLCAPSACGLIDRHGGNLVMGVGALIGAAGLLVLPLAEQYWVYLAGWILLGVSMACILYDPAFTTLTRIFGMASRRPITLVTFAGGLASTVAWPVTHLLITHGSWRSVYFVYAGVLAFVVAPLHAFALPRHAVHVAPPPVLGEPVVAPAKVVPPSGAPFILMAAGFAAHAFCPVRDVDSSLGYPATRRHRRRDRSRNRRNLRPGTGSDAVCGFRDRRAGASLTVGRAYRWR